MELHTDIHNNINTHTNKPSAAAAKPYRLRFYGNDGNYAYLNINPELIGKLKLTPDDFVTQEAIDDNSIIIRKIPRTL